MRLRARPGVPSLMTANARSAVANVVVLLAAAVCLFAAWLLKPGDGRVTLLGWSVPETCLWKSELGRPCPGCGLTRSVSLAVHGRWGDSQASHPSGIWLAGFLAAQAAWRAALLAIRPRGWRRFWWADLAGAMAAMAAATVLPVFAAGRV